jgi:hypothetical protein
MLTDVQLPDRLQPLLQFGDDDTLREGPDGWRDYITELSLTHDDIPALLELFGHWPSVLADDPLGEEPANSRLSLWAAPIHAWRAVAQLKAVEAVRPMLAMADPLDEFIDDWSMEEWPYVFGMIGSQAIDELADYVADSSHLEYARVLAITGLKRIAERHADERPRVVALLTEQLARHEAEAPTLNADIVAALLDLKAVESAEAIERAYAADVVDESVCGGWGEVRAELGVEGLGLAPLERRQPWNGTFAPPQIPRPHWDDPLKPSRDRQKAKRAKAKRKAADKARKRNRRAK